MKYLLFALISQSEIKIPTTNPTGSTFETAWNIVWGFAGAIALLLITIGGFRYVLSQGNAQETAKAKNTIIYALVGLVICIIAVSIVNFVTSRV